MGVVNQQLRTDNVPEGTALEKLLFARDLTPGMSVDAPFLVRSAERRMTRATARGDSKPFLALELADKTGVVNGRVWNDNLQFVENVLVKDSVVRVQGTTQDYNGDISLVITDATPVPDADLGDYVPTSPRDRATMRREYEGLVASIGNGELSNLLTTFTASPEFDDFCNAPAATTDAYAYLGGLLEHTLSVAQMALALATARADIDTDVLLTAALLHEIGKAGSYNAVDFAPDDEVQLLDAATLTLLRLDVYVFNAGGVSDTTRRKLYHAIATHEARGFGQMQPQTKEAVILQSVNSLDIVLAAASSASGGAGAWSEPVRSLRRRFYRGESSEQGAVSGEQPAANGARPLAAANPPTPQPAMNNDTETFNWDATDDDDIPF